MVPSPNVDCFLRLRLMFFSICLYLFSIWWKGNSNKTKKMHIQDDVFDFPQNPSVCENDALCSSKIILTNTGK